MTWAQDQRIAYIKQRIEAGEGVTRPDVAARFNCTIQTVTATFHECKRRYPDLMAYDDKAKAYRRADLVQGVSGLSWKERALAAEAKVQALTEAMLEACDLLAERTYGSHARSPGHNARLRLESALRPTPSEQGAAPRDPTKLPAKELTDAELIAEQTRVEKLWDSMWEPDEDGNVFEGHGGSPGEWMVERMGEIATEQGRRADGTVVRDAPQPPDREGGEPQ